jgi:hypothetical protein
VQAYRWSGSTELSSASVLPSIVEVRVDLSRLPAYQRYQRAGSATTRASPPGHAAASTDRRETYGAALQQFDELVLAASTVSPVSRPLPLYYAVHQAGKAIAAALVPGDWEKINHGHGLGEDRAADAMTWRASIPSFRVVPKGSGIFRAVAGALGSRGLTGSVELGALWAALPGVEAPIARQDWPPALPTEPLTYGSVSGLSLYIREEHLGRRGPDADCLRNRIARLTVERTTGEAEVGT